MAKSDKRLWCYGLSKYGNFYGNEVYPFEERWEAVEKGEELARHEGLTNFYIARVKENDDVEDIERVEVRELNDEEVQRINVRDLNKKADEIRFYSSRKSHFLTKK